MSAELTDVLTELSKLSGGFWIGDESTRLAFFQEHGMAARYLAFRADRLLAELPASDLNSFELGMIAQAFFLNSENEKADEYFDQAFAVAFASPCADRSATLPVRLSLLRSRADCMFALNRRDEGAALYERALELNQSASLDSDATIEADVWATIGWSNGEFGLANTEFAETLLQRADAMVLKLQVPWRRTRGENLVAQVRAWRAQMAAQATGHPLPAAAKTGPGPISGAIVS